MLREGITCLIFRHGAFSFKDLDKNHGLVVGGGREDLALLGGDGSTALDEVGHDTAGGLDTKSQGADIDQKNALGALLAREDTTLNSGTVGNSLIGVDGLVELTAAEVLAHKGLDLGDTGRATDEDNVVDLERSRHKLK